MFANESKFQTNDASITSKNENISTPNTLTSNIRLSKVKENLKKTAQNKNNLNKITNDNAAERKKTATFHNKPLRNFMKKSSIDFTLRENAEENKENLKINEKKPRNVKKSLTLSMSTTDFSNNSKKEGPRKTAISTKTAVISAKKSAIKKNSEKASFI